MTCITAKFALYMHYTNSGIRTILALWWLMSECFNHTSTSIKKKNPRFYSNKLIDMLIMPRISILCLYQNASISKPIIMSQPNIKISTRKIIFSNNLSCDYFCKWPSFCFALQFHNLYCVLLKSDPSFPISVKGRTFPFFNKYCDSLAHILLLFIDIEIRKIN